MIGMNTMYVQKKTESRLLAEADLTDLYRASSSFGMVTPHER